METEGSLPCPQKPASGPYPGSDASNSEACISFRNKSVIHGEELSTPRPTHKLVQNLLSAFHDCLFSIFAATSSSGSRLLYPGLIVKKNNLLTEIK